MDNQIIPIVAIVAGTTLAAVVVFFGVIKAVSKSKAQERSRREIAAYVAEGTMTAEEGERLMKAAPKEED